MALITLNGKPYETEYLSAFQLRNALFNNNDVVIYNGFQITEDCPIQDGDLLFIFKNGSVPNEDILDGMLSARYSPKVYKRIKQAKVAVAGLGGLGSNIAVMLARIGVGHLLLVDSDTVEPSNLNRQCYLIRHLGLPKTTALQELLQEINPYITVEVQNVRVDSGNAVEIFKDFPIVCEAFDRSDCKAMLVNTLLENLPETKIVCGSGMAGFGSSNSIRTERRMKNLYICGDLSTESQGYNSLMAPRVSICAGHQANMVLRLLLGIEEV
jgi:sulfur carrier protein ThiS adenylyltransferase